MKRTLIFTVLCCTMAVAFAAPVTPRQAASVARTFWVQNLNGKADAHLIDRTAEWPYSGIYLFTCPTGGFVMVAADDAVRPILGYATNGQFDVNRIPIQLQDWLSAYQQHIDWVRANDGISYPSDMEAWQTLQAGKGIKDASDSTVAPLLTVLWDQQEPYNELCPPNTVSGCVATAQAMIMKYWNHPAVGYGSDSYVHNRYGVQSADFGHTLYDWAHMPDQPTTESPDRERLAVATLMYHCGVSLHMNYGTVEDGGSSAIALATVDRYTCINSCLKNHFGYSRDMIVRDRDIIHNYTNEQWRTFLVNELDLHHPIAYCGSSDYGGHAFVCDGYDSRQYMHFNFGWSGIGNGYYTVDSISPGVGGAGGNITYSFNVDNMALFGAVPEYVFRTSDSQFQFGKNGGSDSLILCTNPTVNATWSVENNAAWITIDSAEIGQAGWIRFHVDTIADNNSRVATLIFRQGNDSCLVTVMQSGYNEDDLCPLTVVMESTHSNGWLGGAHLTLQTAEGFVFGTATLDDGALDSVQINVASQNVYAVWHSGGGTDRYINYRILNQYGQTLVDVEYAYRNAGTHLIGQSCDLLGIDEPENEECIVWPNPVHDMLRIGGMPMGSRAELYDITGRQVLSTTGSTLSLQSLAKGTYLLRLVSPQQTSTLKIIKH